MSMTKRRVSPRLFACRLAWLDRARVFVVQPVRFSCNLYAPAEFSQPIKSACVLTHSDCKGSGRCATEPLDITSGALCLCGALSMSLMFNTSPGLRTSWASLAAILHALRPF